MAPFAKIITVTFEKSIIDYGKKAVWTGNPVRRSLKIINYKLQITNYFDLNNDIPTILILGGGTGAVAINKLVEDSLDGLTEFCQVIHVAGRGKMPDNIENKNYQVFGFLNAEQLGEAYAVSDIVVSRGGMGTLTELSYLGKPAIIIPMPDSHQEDNAEIFKEKEAAIVLDQKKIDSDMFLGEIRKLLGDNDLQKKLRENIGR
ncbi:MAG: glycosyltransferase, partial [Patescibacteria group bacterium]